MMSPVVKPPTNAVLTRAPSRHITLLLLSSLGKGLLDDRGDHPYLAHHNNVNKPSATLYTIGRYTSITRSEALLHFGRHVYIRSRAIITRRTQWLLA